MIKKLNAEDIAQILKLEDSAFNDIFKCDIGVWVQFLIQNIDNDALYTCGSFKDGVLKGYMVATFRPNPLCSAVSVLYSRTAGLEENKKSGQEDIKLFDVYKK